MPDIKGNNKQIFDFLSSKGASGIGNNADEFQKFMERDSNRRQVYDYLSSVKATGLGNSYEEFSSFVYDGGQQQVDNSKWAVTPSPYWNPQEQKQEEAPKQEAQPAEQPKQQAQPQPQPAPAPQPQAQQTEENPFPYGGGLEKEAEELRTQLAEAQGDADFVKEYEERKAALDAATKDLRNLKGDIRNTGIDLEKFKADGAWLKENAERYEAAKADKAQVDEINGQLTEIEKAEERRKNEAAVKARNEKMRGQSGNNAVRFGPGGFASYPEDMSASEMKDYFAADRIDAMTDQELDKGSKFDAGYEDNPIGTAITQYIAGGVNNVDFDSLTAGLTEYAAFKEVRDAAEKNNGLINGAFKSLGYDDAAAGKLISDAEDAWEKLQPAYEQLEPMARELKDLEATLDALEKAGDADKYTAVYNKYKKKYDEYAKLLDEYKPLQDTVDKYTEMMDSVQEAVANGLSDGERDVLDSFARYVRAQGLSAVTESNAAKAGAGFEQSLEFMLDFFITRGLGKAGTKAASKIASWGLLNKKLGETGAKIVGKGLADMGVAAMRTSLMFPRSLATYSEQFTAMNKEGSGVDEFGRYTFDRTKANAALNTALSQYIEYWSEGFGEYFGAAEQALFRGVTKNAPKIAVGQTLKNYRGSIGKYLDYGKFDGMFNEMLEEVVGSTFNALNGWLSGDRVGDSQAMKEFFAGDNLATLFFSFLPLSAIGAATNMKAYHRMKERYDNGVSILNPLLENGSISREELDALTSGISEMTPEQIRDKVVELTDNAREKNGGALPKDFAQGLMGYLEGSFSMGLQREAWEDSAETFAVANAYAAQYENPDARNAWDLAEQERQARSAALAAGFTEEELDRDSSVLSRESTDLKETEPERAGILYNYSVAKAQADGLKGGYDRESEEEFSRIENTLRGDEVNGNIIRAKDAAGNDVLITSQDATVDGGRLNTPTGEDGLVNYITPTGEKAQAKAGTFTDVSSTPTGEYVAAQRENFMNAREQFFDRMKNTVSPTGQARAISEKVGRNIIVRDGRGVYEPFTVERMTTDENGMPMAVLSGDKKALQGIAEAMGMRVPTSGYLEAPVASLYPLLAKEENGTLTTGLGEESQTESVTPAQRSAPAAEQGSELGDLRDRTVPISVNGQAVNAHVINVADGRVTYEETDADGNVTRTASLPELDFSRAMVEAEAPTVEAAEAETQAEEPAQAPVSTIPVDEKTGEKLYEAPGVSVEEAIADLYATEGLTEADVDQYIADQAAKAEAARNPERGDMSPQAWGQAKQEAARVADFWSAMQRAAEQRKAQQEEAIEEAVEEATPAATEGAPAAQPAAEAQQRVAPAATPMTVDSRRKVVTRLKNWSRRTGVKISIRRSVDEVQDETAKKALQEGRAVTGWYNDKTGEVEVFLPNVMNAVEADKTFIHETVSHKGLRGLLGEDGYNELCDRVWNELMTSEEQAEFMEYNRHLQGSDEYLHRAAADEYIARLSENLDMPDNRNIFERIVDWIMDLLGLGGDVSAIEEGAAERAAGAGSITRSDLYDLLEDSLKRFEKGRSKVSDVLQDENGDVRFSEATYMPFKDKFGNEHEGTRLQLINYLTKQGFPQKQIDDFVQHMDYWYDFTQNIANLVNPDGSFRYQAFHEWSETIPEYKKYEGKIVKAISTLVTNGEYPLNFELSTDCIKREAFTQIINEMLTMDASFWKKLTPANIIEVQNLEKAYGIEVACPLCFVEAKRLNILSWATGVADKWNTALKAVAPGVKHTPFGFYKDGDMTVDQVERKNGEVIITQKVKQEIDTINSFLGDAKNLRDKDAKRLRDNAKEMEKVLNGWIKAYAEEHGDIAGFTLTKKQEAQLEKIRNRNMKSATGRMMRIIATHPEVRHTLSPMDLLGSTGLMRIQSMEGEGFAEMLSAIVSANGTGTPKIVQSAVPYDGEIIDVSQARFEKAAGIGGARLFSFSDADLTKIFDIMQIMWDCAARQAKVQSYSKEVPYIVLFGTSGVKINMSMLPEARPGEETERQYRAATQAGKQRIKHDVEEYVGLQVDQDGNIVGLDLSDSHSITDEFARWIFHNPEYNANCGAIMVGIGVNHAIYCMMQPHIRMLIPFHLSGMPLAAREKGDVFWYHDFTNEQNTGVMVDGVRVKLMGKNGSIVPSVKEEFNIYEGEEKEDWDIRERCREYIKWCDENGLLPKFPWAVNAEGYANWMREHGYEPRQDFIDAMNAHTTDGVWDEYYKVITDFTAYQPEFDEAGNMIGEKSARHLPVTGRINTDPELLKTVFGTNAEGNEVISEESMLSNRERSIQNANKHAREIAALAIDMLNSGKKASDMVDMSGSQFNNKADSELFLQERELPMPEGMKDVEGESPADVDVTEGGVTMFRERTAPAPKNTKTGYAAFAVLPDGKGGYALYPKMVQAEGGQGTPVLTWLDAETGEIRRDENGDIITNTLGRIQVQDSSIDKKGKANKGQGLAWRPGKHLAEYPNATQFAVKNPKTGEKDVMQDNIIFFEVSFAADKDYQTEAWEYGFNKNGKYNHSQAGLPYIPVDGYYKYRTNVNPDIPAMIITGSYKIEKALTDAQAKEINQKLGGTWLERESGKPVDEARLRELGLAEDQLAARRDAYDFSAIQKGRNESAQVMTLEGYTPRAINFDDKNLMAAARENGQDLDAYREGYQSPEERGWNREDYTSGTRFREAPNGKPSNLTDEQWQQVRTPEFKAWFGDWENDPANASKVVDENGEPRIVYHGTKMPFWSFDGGKNRGRFTDGLNYFALDRKFSEDWARRDDDERRPAELNQRLEAANRKRREHERDIIREIKEKYGEDADIFETPEWNEFFDGRKQWERENLDLDGMDYREATFELGKRILPVYINARNPYNPTERYDSEGRQMLIDLGVMENPDEMSEMYARGGSYLYYERKDVVDELKRRGYDAIYLSENVWSDPAKNLRTIAVWDAERVKSATDNNGGFDPNNSDIRFREANRNQLGFVSNAEASLDRIKMDKATPEQWVKMIEKEGGMKAGEDKWLGLSDWLKSQDRKSIAKQEIADYIDEHRIQIEEVNYADLDNDAALAQLQEEFNTIPFDSPEAMWEEADRRVAEFYSEMEEKYGEDYLNEMTQSERVAEENLLDERERWSAENAPSDYESAFHAMVEKYGDDFETAFGVSMFGSLYIENEEAAEEFLGTRASNRVRLNYTTDGLENKREIALVVPTIESWNESDEIHFGDAGNGRAVAWIRFGDTLTNEGEETANKKHSKAARALNEYREELIAKYALRATGSKRYTDFATPEEMAKLASLKEEEKRLYDEWDNLNASPKRVLVIDEIQSKRHQEAREQGGYKDDSAIKRAEAKMDAAQDEYDKYTQGLIEKYGGFNEMRGKLTPEENAESQRLYSAYQDARTAFNRNGFDPMEDEEYRRLRAEQQEYEESSEFRRAREEWTEMTKSGDIVDRMKANRMIQPFQERNRELIQKMEDRENELADEFNKTHRSRIPAAPFEKNWHELAMKRMLRLAAEEGYDYVAWTTGGQQAERYSLSTVVDSIERKDDADIPNAKGFLLTFKSSWSDDAPSELYVNDEGTIVDSTTPIHTEDDEFGIGSKLSELVGKDAASRMMKMEEGERIEGEGIDLGGGEGMKGFYDDILPRFMDKYGKKWGVKASDITLPNVEEAGRVMHAVPVTQEMKESVLQGQTMFREADAAAREEARQSERRDELAHNWTANAGLRLAKRDIENGVQLSRQNPGLTLRLGLPSGALLAAGIRDQQIVMSEYDLVEDSANGYGDKHSYHPFDLDDLKDLASLINHPIAVFRDPNNPYARILLLDKKGYNLSKKESGKHDYIAIIKSVPVVDKRGHYVMDSNGKRTYENRISTIYPADRSWRNLYNQLRNNSSDVTWVDNKKISFWVKGHSSNVRAYDAITQKDIANIQKRFENKQDLLREESKNLRTDGSTRFREKIDPESQKLFDAAKERFGTTRDIREAGYILPDGTMLDFSGRHWTSGGDNSWLNGMRQVDHREISDIEFERDGNTPTGLETDMPDFIRRGAIRISYPGSINLATKPTREQGYVLERLINADNSFVRVDFGDGSRSEHYADYDNARSSRIIADINRYFDDGVKPQGYTMFRDARTAQVGYEEEIQKATTAWLLEWQDQDIPVRIAINQVMNEVGMKDIPEDADYLTRHNLVSSRADAQMHNYKLFYFEPMMDTIGRIEDILVGGKPTVLDRLTGRREKRLDAYGEIVDYSYAVSGLERNAWKRAEAKANKEKELERLAEKWEKESEAINADSRLTAEEKSRALNRAEKRYRKEQDKIDEKYADRDYSGITALMGRPKEEWQEAEADARAMIAEFQNRVNNNDLLNEMWDRIRACTDFNLEHAYKFGLLSRAEYERLHGTESQPRMWEYYLPLRGFSERTAEDEYTYAMFTSDSAGGDIMKKAKGRTTRADDPFAVMRHLSELEIVQGLNNWAKQALYNFVLNAGENTLLTQVEPWYVKEPGTDNWSVAEPNDGESLEAFEARMQEAYEDGDARRGRNGLKLGHIMANKMHRNQHMVRLKINGAEKMIWVNGSPVLAQSVNGVTGWKSRILDGLRTVNRTLSQFYTTYSLNFLTKNMMRDTQFSRIAALVDESQPYLRQLEKNWWANNGYVSFGYPMMKLVAAWESGELEKKQNRTEREQMFIDFMYDGGATGYTMINSMDKIKRELERMVKNAGHGERNIPIIDWYAKGVGALNEASELLTRFTFYQTSRMMGRSRERSAYDAKESSVNFNRRGLRSGVGVSGWTAAAASALYLFMNPAIQGLDKFVRLHKAHPWRMGMVDATYFMMGFVNSLLNAMIAGSSDGDGDDDEKMGPDWYWNIPEWVRRSNMIIGSPFKKLGKWGYLVIALPVEYKGFYAMGELASAIIQGKYAAKDTKTIANEVIGVVSELLPVNPVEGFTPGDNPFMSVVRNMTPGALAPIMDVATNRSFAGIPLWKENIYDETQPLSQSSFASTPEILNKAVIKLAEVTSTMPWHVDIPAGAIRGLLKGYGGGAYTFVENTAKFIFADEAHPRRYEQLPFVSGFTGYLEEDRRDTFNSDALQRYKELSDHVVTLIRSAAPGEDIKAKDVYDNPDNLPASARVTRLLHSDEWILGKMYYDGMKKAGDDVKRLRTAWKKAKDEYLELADDKNATAEQLDAAEEKVQQAWLEFTMNEGNLVDRLMEEEYNHARQKVQNGIPYERKETLGEKAYNLTNKK